MATPAGDGSLDRRARRRRETVEEVLDVALEVMAESGAGGLSLGEVARRMGIRPPSLYQYFPSKNALYDALFARGWQQVNELMAPRYDAIVTAADPLRAVVDDAVAFTRWAVEHPVYAALMFWRPVPGFEPSEAAYAPAVEGLERFQRVLGALVERGVLRPEAAQEDGVAVHTALLSGVISQHLSNEPGTRFEQGRFTRLLPLLLDMYLDRFATKEALDAHHDDNAGGDAAADPAESGGRGGRRPARGVRRRDARARRG